MEEKDARGSSGIAPGLPPSRRLAGFSGIHDDQSRQQRENQERVSNCPFADLTTAVRPERDIRAGAPRRAERGHAPATLPRLPEWAARSRASWLERPEPIEGPSPPSRHSSRLLRLSLWCWVAGLPLTSLWTTPRSGPRSRCRGRPTHRSLPASPPASPFRGLSGQSSASEPLLSSHRIHDGPLATAP